METQSVPAKPRSWVLSAVPVVLFLSAVAGFVLLALGKGHGLTLAVVSLGLLARLARKLADSVSVYAHSRPTLEDRLAALSGPLSLLFVLTLLALIVVAIAGGL